MKKLLFLFAALLMLIQYSYPQDCFVVLKTKGTILSENTGMALKKDDQICSTDNVIFTTKDAVAILYSATKGKYTIKANKKSENEISGIFSSIISNVLSQSTGNTFTRPLTDDLKKSFYDPFYVIDSMNIYVNEEDYPLNEKAYFSIEYSHNQINCSQKLKGNKSNIIFNNETAYKINGSEIDQNSVDKVTLYYNDISKSKIKSFALRFIDGNELKGELSAYTEELRAQGKGNKEILDNLIFYMNAVYGEFDSGYLYNWFEAVLNLKD
jgi:hypothetical protein